MAKKRVVKKSGSKSQPIHFKNLNLNKKILSIVLIVLALGIIGNIFKDEKSMTGNLIFDNPTFTHAKYTVDGIIRTAFDPLAIEDIIIYERFVLFLLLFALLSAGAKALHFEGITNLIIAGAISLISVWFIPPAVFAMIGVTYSSVYAAALILLPVLIVGYIAWKIPPTKGGCGAKAVIFFILMTVFGSVTAGGTEGTYFGGVYDVGNWFITFTETLMLALFILAAWFLIKALSISSEKNLEIMNKWKTEQQAGVFMPIIVSEVGKRVEAGAQKYLKTKPE